MKNNKFDTPREHSTILGNIDYESQEGEKSKPRRIKVERLESSTSSCNLEQLNQIISNLKHIVEVEDSSESDDSDFSVDYTKPTKKPRH